MSCTHNDNILNFPKISMIKKFLCLFLLYVLHCNAFNSLSTFSRTIRLSLYAKEPSSPKQDYENKLDNIGRLTSVGLSSIIGYNIIGKSVSSSLQSSTVNGVYSNNIQDVLAATGEGEIVVLGSNGKTGKLIVEGLAVSGNKVKPTFRGTPPSIYPVPETAANYVLHPVQADVKSVDSLVNAVTGASAVIFAASASSKGGNAKEVDYIGVENTAKACIQAKIPKLVVISSGAVTKPKSLGYKITNLFGNIMDYKLQGENAMANLYSNSGNSDLSYVVIRPGGLTDGKSSGSNKMEINQGDTISGEVNRSDVAECAIAAALSNTIPKNVIFELYEASKSGPLQGEFPAKSGLEQRGASYDDMFKGLKTGINGA